MGRCHSVWRACTCPDRGGTVSESHDFAAGLRGHAGPFGGFGSTCRSSLPRQEVDTTQRHDPRCVPDRRHSGRLDHLANESIDEDNSVSRWRCDDHRWDSNLGRLGMLGTAGGLVFWLTLRHSGVLAVTRQVPAETTLGRSRIGIFLAGTAVAASVAVSALPSITRDRSCHNMFRDGRSSARPMANIDLDIGMDDWPRFTKLLEGFGTSHGMSFRNSNDSKPSVEILGLSACSEEGLVITANEFRWASRSYAPPMAGWGVPIGVFDLNDGIGWQPVAQELVAALASEWPGKVRFRDGNGRFVPGFGVVVPQANSAPRSPSR